MANIASLLKDEIARVARKEVRGETQRLKKASTQYRSDIAALKRRLLALEQQVARLGKATTKKAAMIEPEAPGTGIRFSTKSLISQRRRLGLSAAGVATLLGVSTQSVYNWEDGKSRPRASQIPAIAALRSMSKKEAAAKLEASPG